MNYFNHIGTVAVLRQRIYNLDQNVSSEVATEVIVEPGIFPLMSDGYSTLWIMKGVLNGNFLRRGDGMFLAAGGGANAMLTNIHVEFPSRIFGPDDWQDLLAHETCREGHPEQRLRITLIKEEV